MNGYSASAGDVDDIRDAHVALSVTLESLRTNLVQLLRRTARAR